VTSRPEIEISDKRLAFSSQTSSTEPSYKTGPKQVKNVDFSGLTRFFENIPLAECSSHRQASKTPQFGVVYRDISIRKFDSPRLP
jgi:hypothetical protein